MDLSCKKCGSDHTQKVSAIYGGGTSHGSASSSSNTFGMVGDAPAVAVTSTSTSSFSQSVLAERLQPPTPKATGWLVAALIGAPVLAFVGGFVAFWAFGLIFRMIGIPFSFTQIFALLGAALTYAYYVKQSYTASGQAKKYNKEEYPRELAAWRNRFYCHRCDSVFAVE